MKISTEQITALVSQGYMSLQVPEFDVDFQPDDWFIEVKCVVDGYRLCFGRERGFVHLSPKGFEANKTALKEAFEEGVKRTGRNSGATFTDLHAHATAFFL